MRFVVHVADLYPGVSRHSAVEIYQIKVGVLGCLQRHTTTASSLFRYYQWTKRFSIGLMACTQADDTRDAISAVQRLRNRTLRTRTFRHQDSSAPQKWCRSVRTHWVRVRSVADRSIQRLWLQVCRGRP